MDDQPLYNTDVETMGPWTLAGAWSLVAMMMLGLFLLFWRSCDYEEANHDFDQLCVQAGGERCRGARCCDLWPSEEPTP